MFRHVFLVALAFSLLGGELRATNRYVISTRANGGVLAVIGTQVVVSDLKEYREQLWVVEKAAKPGEARHIVMRRDGKKWYLTANKEGDVFVADKPTDGSFWGIELPDRGTAIKSWIGNHRLEPDSAGPRCLFVDFNSRVRDESGNEVAANPVRLGKPPKDGRYESPDTQFRVSLIAP
jgi:hypothetical protein